jgi:serine phosphatase RsbU (regulator of sigma subunit)
MSPKQLKAIERVILSDSFARKIKLSYRINILFIAASLPFSIVFQLIGFTGLAISVVIFNIFFALSLVLSCYTYQILGRLLMLMTGTAALVFYSLLLGENAGVQYIPIAFAAIPFVLFDKKEHFWAYLSSFFTIATFFISWHLNYSYPGQLSIALSGLSRQIIFFLMTIVAFVFSIGSVFFYKRSSTKFESDLQNSNNRLSRNYNRVKQMITKIRAQQAMEADLEKGKKLQNSVLPQRAPKLENVIITHAFEPAKTLSGDYFDYFLNKVTGVILPKPKKNEDDDNYDDDDEGNVIYKQIGIVVADVVGKGVAASLEMFSVKTVLKLLHDHWFEPQALVTRMNQISTDSHLFSKYVPLIYVTVTQVETYQYLLEYVNAGHEPAIVVRATGTVEILDQGGAPVGMDADEKYIQNAITLYPGDVTFVITDGCTDVKSPTGEVIGHEELIPILIEASKQKNVDIAKYVRNRLRDFQGNAAQPDDMTIVAIQIL